MNDRVDRTRPVSARERGSAMLMAIFVLSLVASVGVGLCFLGQTEARMSKSSVRLKQAFYLAEAGLEDGRTTLYNINGSGDFTNDLLAYAKDGKFDLDVSALRVIYDADGNPTGLTGHGDDEPLRPLGPLGNGWYAAFLTNDPAEGQMTTADANWKVMVTGVGIGPDKSLEIAQVIVERWEILPSVPPATITILGPDPVFEGGNSNAHNFSGDDCGGFGDPDIRVPVVGAIGPDGEADAEEGIEGGGNGNGNGNGPDYESGGWHDEDTIADLLDPANEPTLDEAIDAGWLDCQNIHDLVEAMRGFADVYCTDGSNCPMPAADISNLILIDDDYEVLPPGGAGTLVVTGTLTFNGRADWDGIIFVFGEGQLVQSGAGNGTISGAIMVADIAGPDSTYDTADDCTGGTNGFHSASFDLSGGGNADTFYCTANVAGARPQPPYRILGFRQY